MAYKSDFDTFLSNIEPTQNQKEEASTGHITLRERLQRDDKFREYYLDSFVSGSYGRDTAIRPIKDVDIIVVMNIDEKNEPKKVIDYLYSILQKFYNNVKRQTRSVNVALSYINMDIVPSIAPSGTQNILIIPDMSEKTWIKSHPRKHIKLSTDMNKKQSNLYKPLVKAIKEWRDVRMSDTWKPKSFILESIVYNYSIKNTINNIPSSIKEFYVFIYNEYKKTKEKGKWSPYLKDPAGTDTDIAKDWTYSDFSKFYDESLDSWRVADAALKETNNSKACELWRQILGQKFPK